MMVAGSLRGIAALCCLALAVLSLGNGVYISLKAELAQILIENSWREGRVTKPWPWADTWPLAKLSFDTDELYILAGSHGSALAFGPGHVDGTALPGEPGTSVIGGHRDTHFRNLGSLVLGDNILLQSLNRDEQQYVVDAIGVVDTRLQPEMALDVDKHRLVLVTCYPFDAFVSGGPLRYVVEATKVAPVNNRQKKGPVL